MGQFRQGGGGSRHQRAGRGEGQPLQREGAALQVATPRVVGEPAPGEPVLPVVSRPVKAALGLLVGPGRAVLAPGQGAEAGLALVQERPGHRPAVLETQPHVGGQREPHPDVRVGCPADALVVGLARVGPGAPVPPVAEDRLAVERHLHLAGHAAHGPQQDVRRVVVGGGPPVGARQFTFVMPGAHEQRVLHDQPARRGAPAGFQHHGARDVPAGGRDGHAFRAEPEPARRAVQDRPEHTGRVQPRQAHPLHVAAGRDQGGGLTVGEEPVFADRRERRPFGSRPPGDQLQPVPAGFLPGVADAHLQACTRSGGLRPVPGGQAARVLGKGYGAPAARAGRSAG